MMHLNSPELTFAVGILGNLVSLGVFLSPLRTFYRIYKMKHTQGYKSTPYSIALFSCSLLLYYGSLKTTGGLMIISINTIGTLIEATYLTIFLIYAPKAQKILTAKFLCGFNLGVYGAVWLTTYLSFNSVLRVTVVGWICAIFSVLVFASPLSVMRLVVRTKSVDYMPFGLSLALTLCAIMWFSYGLLIKDYYIALPNVLGFVLGITQMIIYLVYRNASKKIKPDDPKKIPATTDIELANTDDAPKPANTPKSPEHVINMDQQTEVTEVVEENECGNKTERAEVAEPERMIDIHHPIPVAVCG